MKRTLLILSMVILILLSGCGDTSLLNSSDTTSNWGSSVSYDIYVAYAVGDMQVLSIDTISIESDIDTMLSVNTDDRVNVDIEKKIEYNGQTYETGYKRSLATTYNTILDVYDDSIGSLGTTFWINRDTGEIVSIAFDKNMALRTEDDSHARYKENSFYIEIAQNTIIPFVDISDYTVRCVSSDSVPMYAVYFEKYEGGFLLTSSYVYMLPSGIVTKIHTERDYDWNNVRVPEINRENAQNALENKFKSICEDRNLNYAGYKISYERIVPDKNGRLAIYYTASAQIYENDADITSSTGLKEFLIYIE